MKKQATEYHISLTQEDFTSEKEYNIVEAKDSLGNSIAVDTWKYAIYFAEHIQRHEFSKHRIFIDGIRLDKFVKLFVEKSNKDKISDFLTNQKACQLYQEMKEKHNTHINWVALYGLCAFIQEIINRRLSVLLKPTTQDTLNEIGGFDNLDKISFKLKNGNCHTTSLSQVKQLICDSLEKSDNLTSGTYKIVRKVDVYTKEYGQIAFVRYLSKFFHEYFDTIKRRANSYLTTTEQNLICLLLYYFDYTPEIVQESRFRQLFTSKFQETDHLIPLNIPGLIESNVELWLEIIPYTIWRNGKINPLKENSFHQEAFPCKFNMKIEEDTDITQLLTYIDGIIG